MNTIGSASLIIAAVLSTVAFLLASKPARRGLLVASVVALWIAMAVAVVALIREDTSLVLVVEHTRTDLSWPRRVMGLWGGSEGSLLLFTTIVATILAMAPTARRVAWVAPLITATLAWSLTTLAPPFETLAAPAIRGSGLSPILEHWAMLIHPPLLYAGLALALVPALAPRDQSTARWTTAALVALTGALALGGRWAYVELGWGGWWAWDPVENVALIPWLLLLVHVHLPSQHWWTRCSAYVVWPAVFAGTAMTRTSLRTSVHSFANADGLGWTLWPLTAVLGAAAVVLAVRDRTYTRARPAVMLASIVVLFSAVVIALGTFRPFLPGEATAGWFYTRALFPVVIGALLALGVGPRWTSDSHPVLLAQAGAGFVLTAITSLIGGWTEWYQVILAGSLGATTLPTLAGWSRHGAARTIGHLGMVAVLAGALGGTASQSLTFDLGEGETRVVDGAEITNLGVDLADGAPPVVTSTLDVDGSTQRPSIGIYAERGLRLPEIATKHGFFVDRQYILRSADDDGSITVTANTQPFTSFVWLGVVAIIAAFVLRGQSALLRFSRRAFKSSLTVDALAGDTSTGSGSG
ncbi:MAG: cytochrome c biogenesis protein CcsA [Acidimicrobiales bacterium]|nr:cytochrome c biogenesis protein CcsA [Acidimicrobiales bacterium]